MVSATTHKSDEQEREDAISSAARVYRQAFASRGPQVEAHFVERAYADMSPGSRALSSFEAFRSELEAAVKSAP